MTVGLAGRGVAMIGIVLGLLAVGLELVSSGGAASRYLDHGVVTVFVIALLSMASYLPAEVGYDTAGAAAGTAVFGFYVYVPAIFAFSHLGAPGAAAWLGLGTALIPIGLWIVKRAEGHHSEPAPTPTSLGEALANPLCAVAGAGLILITAGIWLPVITDGPSYWNASYSGDALGILLLIAVVANVVTLIGPLVTSLRVRADTVLLVACATFGFVAAQWLESAFDHLGSLGTGGWMEATGGLLLLGGVVVHRLSAGRGGTAAAPVPQAS